MLITLIFAMTKLVFQIYDNDKCRFFLVKSLKVALYEVILIPRFLV